MILLTAAIVLAAAAFLAHRLRERLRHEPAKPAAYWLDAIEGSSPIGAKNRLS